MSKRGRDEVSSSTPPPDTTTIPPPSDPDESTRQLTLTEAIAVTSQARCVTTATKPYTIIHTNRAWSELTGFKFTEAAGKTCSILQGPATVQAASLHVLNQAIRCGEKVRTTLINYTREGMPFLNTVECSPVVGDTHYYATVTGTPITDGSVAPLPVREVPPPLTQPQQPPVDYTERQRGRDPFDLSKRVKLADVLANTTDPIVLCEKAYPHKIMHPNQPWLEMCGYSLEEVEGLTNKILTGPETDPESIAGLLDCVRRCQPSTRTLVNYKKGGIPFINQLTVVPVYDDDDETTAFMSMLAEIDPAGEVNP